MTSNPLLVETTERKQFTSIYLKNKIFFLKFFSAFFESELSFENFQKKMALMAYVFPKLATTKDLLR